MTIPTNPERKAMSARYSPPKGKIVNWVVVQCNKVIFENTNAGLCQSYIDKNSLRNAFKKPIYMKAVKVNPQYVKLVITKPINLMTDSLEWRDGFLYTKYHHGKVHLYTNLFCAN